MQELIDRHFEALALAYNKNFKKDNFKITKCVLHDIQNGQ